MSWKIARIPRHTAAWRISLTATFVFAMGTALALFVSYLMVSNLIREQGDTWLYGESQVLEDVAENSGSGKEAAVRIAEAARLALQEVDLGPEKEEDRTQDKPIFFLLTSPQDKPVVWAGPGEVEVFHTALHRADIEVDEAESVTVPGWPSPFRVVIRRSMDGGEVFLGLSDVKATALLQRVTSSFVQVWVGMVLFGFAFCWLSARTILCRVERITATASEIGSHDFHRRVPQGGGE
ncbi:MAG: hypothetical protein ACE5ID_12520, partial [Acidobacteriota bacterium]